MLLSKRYLKFQWIPCFKKFLHHQTSMIIVKRRLAVLSNVCKLLKAAYLYPKDGIIDRPWVESFCSSKILERIFTNIVQREQSSMRHIRFRKLKPQSVRAILNHISNFIAFLMSKGLMNTSEGRSLNRCYNKWKKYLLARSNPKQTPLLDLSLLTLKAKYKQALERLKNYPESICDKRTAVEARDSVLGELCRLCGKRPHGN